MTDPSPPSVNAKCVVITPSYSADLERVAALCTSMDRHFKFAFEHVLAVPKRDLKLFRLLSGPCRRVITKESVLRRFGFRFLPIPSQIVIPGLYRRKFKEQWYHPKAGRIGGWSIQQIIKMAANVISDADDLIFIDSDVELIRDVDLSAFVQNDITYLHEHTAGADLPSHRQWRKAACALIGSDAGADFGMNYIGHMIAWRKETLAALQRRIEAVHAQPWWVSLAQVKNFSEYILYGTFVRSGQDAGALDRHALGDLALVHSLWVSDADEDARFMEGMTSRHVALHIQSTLPMSRQQRDEKIARLKQLAATGDGAL